jgi:hypothetical protein
MKLKFANALSLALIMAMLFTSIGMADQLTPDADILVANNQATKNLGTVAPGAVVTTPVSFILECNGNKHVDNGQTVNLSFTLAGSTVPAGGSLSATNATIGPIPAGWPDDGDNCPSPAPAPISDNGDSTATITAPSSAGTYNYVVAFTRNIAAPDISGGNTTVTFTLTVSAPANTAPSLSLPGNIVAEAISGAGAVVSYSASATDAEDNPDPTPSCSPASGSTFPIATTTVNCSVTDSGGMSASGSFSVTVQDTTAPVIGAHADINTEATSGTGAVVSYTSPATSDAVDGAGTASCAPASGGSFALGNTTVTCNATDAHGNAAIATTFVVHVLDTVGPVLSLPADITTEATGPLGAAVSYTASASDLVDGPVTPSCSPSSGSTFALGTTSVGCSATDAHSNTSNGSFNVTVQDTTAPTIDPHGDETQEAASAAGAVVTYSSPATHDLVDGDGVAACLPASGSTFGLGDTTVNCNASDSAGNDAVQTSFIVHVVDTTDPVITFVSRTAANGNGWNNGDVTVNWSCSDTVGVVSDSVSETVSAEGANQSATGTCEDTSGNTASNEQTGINIDKTAPSISAQRDTAANANGWNNADVASSYTASDTLSGLDSPDSGSFTFTLEGAGQSHIFTVSDKAGNSASATVSGVNIDKTAPSLSGAATTSANGNGWYNGDVTIDWTCSDGLSGIDGSCPVDSVITGEGNNLSAGASVSDLAGNSANATVSGIKIDRTKPTIAAAATTSPNGNGWYNANVTVQFTCSDALSGIPAGTCPTDQILNTEGAAVASTAQTVTDAAGNTSDSSNVVTVKIDKTAPTASASASPAPNVNGWNKTNVTVSFNGNDGSGSGIDFCDANVLLSTEGAGQSASGTCTDKAGNVSPSAAATGINIDKTNPAVSLVGGPANGGSYYFGSVPAAPTCSASDILSGLDGSCSVSGYSGAVGPHTITTSAMDKAGNSASASASYTVLAWTLNGFYQPVDMGRVNIAKNGSTVPLKFEVFAGSTELTNTSIVSTFIQQESCVSLTADDIESYATGGTSLRYDTTGGQFIFNWQTPKVVGGCYKVTLTLQDGRQIFADFKLK